MSKGKRIRGDRSRSRVTMIIDELTGNADDPDGGPLPVAPEPRPDEGLGTFRLGGDIEVMGEQEPGES